MVALSFRALIKTKKQAAFCLTTALLFIQVALAAEPSPHLDTKRKVLAADNGQITVLGHDLLITQLTPILIQKGFEPSSIPSKLQLRVESNNSDLNSAQFIFSYDSETLGAVQGLAKLPKFEKLIGTSLTSDFEKNLPNWENEFKNKTVPHLKPLRVLLISGMMTRQKDWLTTIPGVTRFLGPTYDDQIELFLNSGLTFERITPRTLGSAKTNAALIIEGIRRSKERVVLISHSKGGTDTLEALTSQPELISKVAGWISLQTPFAGAEVAEKLIKLIPCSRLLKDASPSAVQQHYQTPAFKKILSEVPMISVTSETDEYFSIARGVMPGSNFVVLKDVPSHGAVVNYNSPRELDYDRTAITGSLLNLLSQKITP